MQLTPYLHFDGQCETAFKFYEKVLGAKLLFQMTYADSPMADQAPADFRNAIMHARVAVGDQVLMGSDSPPGRYQKPQGFSVSIGVNDAAEADRIFAALSEKGTVMMPIQETFWALRFAMFTDQFGIPWMINCEKSR